MTVRCSSKRSERLNRGQRHRGSRPQWSRLAWLLALATVALGGPASAENWRGLTVAPEHRCSPYERKRDYPYPQSVGCSARPRSSPPEGQPSRSAHGHPPTRRLHRHRTQGSISPNTRGFSQPSTTRARRALPQSWHAFAAGHAQRVQYAAVFGRAGARVEVYIDNTDRDWNKTLFDRLNERRESIEGEFGTELVWSRLEERLASRIAILREGSIDDDDRVLDGVRAWMIERLLAFKRVFGPVLDELTTELG